MKTTLLPIAILATLGLSACNQEPIKSPTEIAKEAADAKAAAAPQIEMPPAIKKNATLRCKDSSLVYVDFYADDKSASVRTEKDGPATRVSAAATGEEMVSSDGATKIKGNDSPIELTLPGKGTQSCKG